MGQAGQAMYFCVVKRRQVGQPGGGQEGQIGKREEPAIFCRLASRAIGASRASGARRKIHLFPPQAEQAGQAGQAVEIS